MLTGLLSSRLPVNDNAEELPATAVTFVHYLRRAGYRTVLSGKMHYVGPDQLHGFEERLTTDIYPADYLWTKTWDSQGDPPRRVGLPGDAETGPSYVRQMAQMVKEAGPVPWSYQHDYDEETHHRALGELRTLARRKGAEGARPWFLCVSYTHPHDPYVNLPLYWDRYEGRRIAPPRPPGGLAPAPHRRLDQRLPRGGRRGPHGGGRRPRPAGYYASTSYFDDKLGSLLGELDRLGLGANTVVLVTADHGDMCGERGCGSSAPCGWAARVPLIAAGPGSRRGSGRGRWCPWSTSSPPCSTWPGWPPRESSRTPGRAQPGAPLRAERPPGGLTRRSWRTWARPPSAPSGPLVEGATS